MRILVTTLSILFAIIGLALSILPFGYIAFIPIIIALVFTLITSKLLVKEGKNTVIIKAILAVIIISTGLSLYNSLKPNEITIDQEAIEKQKQSDEETLEELEDIEIED
jgi:cytochrome bd-type quinol oxidase subunit 2